jgi:class 3 adenylate cyclase
MRNFFFVNQNTTQRYRNQFQTKVHLLYVIWILCLFLSPVLTKAQDQQTIDSLVAQLNVAKDDSNKVNTYLALISGHVYFKNNEGYKYEAPALALATKLNLKKHIYKIKAWTGRLYWKVGQYETALIKHKEALQLAKKYGDKTDISLILIFIGQDYTDQNMIPEALSYFDQAHKIAKSIDDKKILNRLYDLYSYVCSLQGNLPKSIQYLYMRLENAEQLGDEFIEAIIQFNIADYKESIGEDSIAEVLRNSALPILEKSNKIDAKQYLFAYYSEKYFKEKNLDGAIKNLQLILESSTTDKTPLAKAYNYLAKTYEALKNDSLALKNYLLSYENYRETSSSHVAGLYLQIGSCYTRMHSYKKAKEYFNKADSLTKSFNLNSIRTDYLGHLEQLDSALGNWESAYLNYKTYIRNKELINNEQDKAKANRIAMQFDFDKKEAEAKAEQEKKDIIQRNLRNSISGALVGALIFLVVVYRQRNKILKARKLSDELLLNILPEEVAAELKEKGSATAKLFDEVTVMFTDFKGFTQISEKLTPAELVSEIDNCFKAFDIIIGKYNIEKIKTIGDSYMCAGGLPISNTTNAVDVVNAAIEIQQYMQLHMQERKNEGKEPFEIRIGIHTGSVVAGIVGIKKFAYDIWGDTVNIASRMESSGEEGKINISVSTYELVKEKFNCTHRGKIQAKNKGEIDMYFVLRIS